MNGKHKNKTTRFLMVSLISVLVLSVAIFSFLALFMNRQSASTIREVSQMYMSGMSEQIAMHFETTIDLRLDQLDALVKTDLLDNIHDDPNQMENLIFNAQAREFSYLAFYCDDGSFDMLYGSPLSVVDPASFLESLSSNQKKVAVGSDANANRVILLGVPVISQNAADDHRCIALVAGLPASYISDTLSLEENSEHVYSFIIRQDGSFVIRTGDAFRESYFERVRNLYESVDGEDPDLYIDALASAMASSQDYSAEIVIYGESRQMYCTSLAYSEWFLITFMPYNALNRIVNGFTSRWTFIVFSACALILAVLLYIFSRYYRITTQQLIDLEIARLKAEQAEQEARDANRAKSEFLSNMSHDIRTPMNAIVGMTAIATANINNHDQVQNCLKKITLSSKHLLGLINDVLDMSKIESGKMTLNMDQVSLREVMDSLVSIVQPQIRSKKQQFDVFIHDITTENVCCDSVRLNQVLLNLLSNAIKFTPEGGTIYMSLYEESSPKGDDFIRVHLHVKDNGIGMSEEFQNKVFESFVREDSARVHKTEGTGLGMAITKYIVDTMGGTITVHSEQGKGSEFLVILDLEKALVQESDMILPEWKMLVVDDDEQLCVSTVNSLKSIGIKAEWTLDGETAVQMVKEHHAQHNEFDIILLDWKLPGMDGIETAREIRRHLAENVPILLISAYDWNEIEQDARDAGINGFISKPLFKSTLFYGLRPFAGQPEETKEEPAAEQDELTGRRVLLAEDNDLNWEIAEELLSAAGLDLEWAENGQICVDKFQAAQPGYYDAILMDIRMPVMTGYEAAKAIRALDRPDAAAIPIIAMTADAFAEDIKKCLDCGMNAHIAKPINVRDVVRALKKYMS